MQEFGFIGTFYVISSFSDKPNYLTWDDLKTLQAAGNEIGSHTQNHVDLKTASLSIQTEEILGSKKVLEEKLGVPVKSFCYPIGAYNDDAVRIVKESGYTSAVTVAFGHSTCKNNYFLTPRVRVPGWVTLNNFAKNLQL
jgi:peptidoglycan/xylan/chitin deacetylase (PgdA/CDA1 family)